MPHVDQADLGEGRKCEQMRAWERGEVGLRGGVRERGQLCVPNVERAMCVSRMMLQFGVILSAVGCGRRWKCERSAGGGGRLLLLSPRSPSPLALRLCLLFLSLSCCCCCCCCCVICVRVEWFELPLWVSGVSAEQRKQSSGLKTRARSEARKNNTKQCADTDPIECAHAGDLHAASRQLVSAIAQRRKQKKPTN